MPGLWFCSCYGEHEEDSLLNIMAFCPLQLMSTLYTSKTYQVTSCQLMLRRSLLDLGQSNLQVSMSEVRR
jgi:hypothetical protein